MSIVPVAIMPSFYYGEYIMANTATVATSAVAVPAIESINGMSIDQARETMFQIATETRDAEKLIGAGKDALAVLDSNVHDIIKGATYVEFMKFREFHIAGSVDKLDSVDAAQKRFERQVNRIITEFNFVRPKSESKDAVRKAEAKQKEVAKLAEFSDAELEEKRLELKAQDTKASDNEAIKLRKELERRQADAIDAEKVQVNALRDQAIKRVKELAKSGTADATALLERVVLLLG
jgi:hypothetical protein